MIQYRFEWPSVRRPKGVAQRGGGGGAGSAPSKSAAAVLFLLSSQKSTFSPIGKNYELDPKMDDTF